MKLLQAVGRWLRAVRAQPWSTVTTPKAVALGLAAAGLYAVILASRSSWVPILDDANLAFHEAGHPIYGIFGRTMGLYGGTLGQLTFPVVTLVAFWLRRRAVSMAVCGIWTGENLLNIARYVADARARLLPLVGSGDHDWDQILRRWGALQHDVKIARVIAAVGWIGMLAFTAWIGWRWLVDRRGRAEE